MPRFSIRTDRRNAFVSLIAPAVAKTPPTSTVVLSSTTIKAGAETRVNIVSAKPSSVTAPSKIKVLALKKDARSGEDVESN